MSAGWLEVGITLALQLVGIGIIYGRLGEQVKRNAEGLKSQGETIEKHAAMLNTHEVRISVAESYQKGLQDGTSHMRHA